MPLIQFTRNYGDLSTDRGYQFNFYCDKCGNGYMRHFETSMLGIAQSPLNAAGIFFANVGYRSGNADSEIQRPVGGKALTPRCGGGRESAAGVPPVYEMR